MTKQRKLLISRSFVNTFIVIYKGSPTQSRASQFDGSERYEKLDAQYFASFIDQHFNTMFARSCKGLTRLWLQDGDPSQNSKTARDAMARCHSELLKIPPRSPDLNPIENIFNIVSRKLEKDALNGAITRESYADFCDRVQRTIYGISQELIDKTIESMSSRITDIIGNNGERLKY